ncbi:ciliary-associated calcium-binding coiled-coil protein 1 [Ctenodactylus gundi]
MCLRSASSTTPSEGVPMRRVQRCSGVAIKQMTRDEEPLTSGNNMASPAGVTSGATLPGGTIPTGNTSDSEVRCSFGRRIRIGSESDPGPGGAPSWRRHWRPRPLAGPLRSVSKSALPSPFRAPPLALAPAIPAHSHKDSELQEHEKILSPDFLSTTQITDLLTEDIDGVQEKLGIFLNFKNLQTSLKEAILLDYYVSGFLWAKEMNFSIMQYSKFMTLLHMSLHNLETLHMSLEDSIKWLGGVMTEIGPARSHRIDEWNTFDVKQSNAIVDYFKISLFQHYKLYEFMFYSAREEIVIGTEQMIEIVNPAGGPFPDPLEEGISFDIYSKFIEPPPTSDAERKKLEELGPEESHQETDALDIDPLAGFSIEDVKTVLSQVTDDIFTDIQNEISEKLQIQEEAFNARIEKLKKA